MTSDWEQRCAEALRLIQAGQRDQAEAQLRAVLGEVAFAPAMAALATLLMQKGALAEAEQWLKAAEAVAPGDPAVVLGYANLWLCRGDLKRARAYFGQLVPTLMPPFVQKVWDQLAGRAGQLDPLLDITGVGVEEARRADQDDKPISLRVTVAGVLRRLPAPWLKAVAAAHGVQPLPQRKELERAVARRLLDPAHLQAVAASLPEPQRALLHHVLARDGWCTLHQVTRHFGPCHGDGYRWDERPPRSTLGQLRARGLCHVGVADVEGRCRNVVVIPVDLRQPLAAVLPPAAEVPAAASTRTWVFKVALGRSVWRTIEVREDQTLHDLHGGIQRAFGWDDDHLYSFFMSNKAWDRRSEYAHPHVEEAPPADEVTLAELALAPGRKFLYVYDYGDDIRHRITVLEQREAEPGVRYPRVLQARGPAPGEGG